MELYKLTPTQKKIIEYLKVHKYITITALLGTFYNTESCAKQALMKLSSAGIIKFSGIPGRFEYIGEETKKLNEYGAR